MAAVLFSTKPWYQFSLSDIESAAGLFRVLCSLFGGIALAFFFPKIGLGGFFAAYAIVNIFGVALVRFRYGANDEILDISSIAMASNKPALGTLFLSWIVTYNAILAFA